MLTFTGVGDALVPSGPPKMKLHVISFITSAEETAYQWSPPPPVLQYNLLNLLHQTVVAAQLGHQGELCPPHQRAPQHWDTREAET